MSRKRLETKRNYHDYRLYFGHDDWQNIKHLSRDEILLILTKGKSLFKLMRLTATAETYLNLEENKDLKETIAKW